MYSIRQNYSNWGKKTQKINIFSKTKKLIFFFSFFFFLILDTSRSSKDENYLLSHTTSVPAFEQLRDKKKHKKRDRKRKVQTKKKRKFLSRGKFPTI